MGIRMRKPSYIYACTENYKSLKVSIARMCTALLRLLVNVCQWYETAAVLLQPIHERVVICRKIRMQQNVTVHSCQKNAVVVDSFTVPVR